VRTEFIFLIYKYLCFISNGRSVIREKNKLMFNFSFPRYIYPVTVYNMGAGSNKTQPFYHVSQGTADTAQVQIVVDGHFVVAFIETADGQYSDADLLPFIVDPEVVFGT
jgi:hypothetical protein